MRDVTETQPTDTAPAIEIHDLHKSFGDHQVLKGVDFEVGRGEVVCVIGPSGSGKSTLLRCVNLLEEPTSGTIRVSGTEVTDPDCSTTTPPSMKTTRSATSRAKDISWVTTIMVMPSRASSRMIGAKWLGRGPAYSARGSIASRRASPRSVSA